MRPFNLKRLQKMWDLIQQSNRDVFWRHDIDVCVDAALWMAEREREAGIQATYYFALRSPGYNVFAVDTAEIIREIHRLGHEIGLHYVRGGPVAAGIGMQALLLQNAVGHGIVSRTFSTHMPRPEDMWTDDPSDAYNAEWKNHYTSDSAPDPWRSGEPEDLLTYPGKLQILIHPIHWRRGYRGLRTGDEARRMDRFLTPRPASA